MSLARSLFGLTSVALTLFVQGQSPVPIVTSFGRFVVFQDGVFREVETRKPKQVFQNGDRLAYITDAGDLKLFVDGTITKLQGGEPVAVAGSKHMIAWKTGPALRIPKGAGAETICRSVGRYSVTDSIIAYHDQMQQKMMVYWKGRTITMADVLMSSEDVIWESGSNTVLLYDVGGRRVLLFYRGQITVLCNGDDPGRSMPGGDMVAFMDEYDDTFRVFDRGLLYEVDPFAPSSFQVGEGLVAYTSSTGAFRCFTQGHVWDVADFSPEQYWVKDSTLLFVDQGMFKVFTNGAVEIIERYVPNKWEAVGSTVAYLDASGVLWAYWDGTRTRIGRESGIKQFQLYPGVISYVSNSGDSKVWWNGKLYEHY